MDLHEFTALVEEMRAEQKRFFAGDRSAVGPAKKLEREVDRAIVEIRSGRQKLPFPGWGPEFR